MNEFEINDLTEDDKICAICEDGTVYEDNELLTCQKCGVIVHQSCYLVQDLPLDIWLCDVCERNLDPQQVTCAICLHNGSALKMTEDSSKWVHSLCGNWIPDVFLQNGVYNLSKIAPLRYKLGCRLCHRKGAIIQCSYGRCAVSTHPWCAIKENNYGFTHRIVKNPEAPHTLLWEVFCKTHAHAVSEPVKPMVKAKRSAVNPDEPENGRKQKGGKTTKVNSSKKSHKKRSKNVESLDDSDDEYSPEVLGRGISKVDVTVKKRGRPPLHKGRGEDETRSISNCTPKSKNRIISSDDESDDSSHYYYSGDGKQRRIVDYSDSGSEDETHVNSDQQGGFIVHNFSEWPGQAEGEPMDLPHIWNVVSMMYPEDHSKEWIDYMLSVFELGQNSAGLPTDCHEDSFFAIPPLGNWDNTLKKLMAGDEDVINASSLTERDFLSLMDPDKRQDSDQKVDRHIEILQNCFSENHDTMRDKSTSTANFLFPLSNLSSITSRTYDSISDPSTIIHSESVSLAHVVFNGITERIHATFQMRLKSDSCDNSHLWREINLQNESHKINCASDLYRMFGLVAPQIDPSSLRNCLTGEYCLTNCQTVDSTQPVLLPDRDILSLNDESDEILSFMNRNMSQLQQVSNLISKAVNYARNLPTFQSVHDEIDRKQKQEIEWSKTISLYSRQRIWGYVSRGLMRGIKDQSPDFNQATLASLPASWTLRVEGRPDGLQEENDAQTDTVCMCCFDGITSEDSNKIIFCDGCNSSLHQMCYGIHEVPEGDYYCQRCLHIQGLIDSDDHFEPEEIKNLVVCCLCQRHHGGLKPTTDGRWVHMCCVFWAKDCVIENLENMAPIDISQIMIRAPTDSSRKSRPSLPYDDNTESSTACMVCNLKSGFLVQCCHSTDDFSCKRYFHPICAWFAGHYVETILTDPTNLGGSRDGNYPSGVEFKFYCVAHTPSSVTTQSSQARQIEQQHIRVKYRIDEADLSIIPGKIIKKKKQKKKSATTERISKNVNKVKELSIDTYSENICAICMSPTHRMLPMQHEEDALHSEICCCTICHITVHLSCLKKYSTIHSSNAWKCEKCSYLELIRIESEEKDEALNPETDPEIKCSLCPRRGGAFMRRLLDNKWVHYYCEAHRPITRQAASSDSTLNKEKKHNCVYCNRKSGVCVRCCDPKGCPTSFHPLCASRSGDAYARIRENIKEVFCKHHIPDTVYHLPNGYWVDLTEVSNLRKSLDSARLILDLVKSREKVKKRYYLAQESKLDSKIQHSLRKLKKKFGDSVDLPEESESENQDSEIDSVVAGVNDMETEYPEEAVKRRGRPPKISKSPYLKNFGDTELVSTSKKLETELPAKRNSKLREKSMDGNRQKEKDQVPLENLPLGGVDLSGQEVKAVLFLKSNRTVDEYHKFMKDEFRKTVDDTRATIGLFSSQRSYVEFQKQLKVSVDLLSQKTLLDVAKEYSGSPEDLKYAKAQMKKQKTMKQRKSVESSSIEAGSRKRGRPSIEETEAAAPSESESLVTEPSKKRGRGRSNSEPVKKDDIIDISPPVPAMRETSTGLYDQTEHEFLKFLENKWQKYPFSLFSNEILPIYRRSSPSDYIIHVNSSGDNWESLIQVQLERQIFHTLQCISACIIPLSGPLVDYKNPESAITCFNLMKNCVLAGKDLSVTGWWAVSSSEKVDGRLLINEYEDLTDEDPVFVANLILVGTLKDRLQKHRYSSFALFAKDFYEMLSNRRFHHPFHSKIYWDSTVLSDLFQFYRDILIEPSYSLPSHVSMKKVISPRNDTAATSDMHYRICSFCSQNYLLTGYANEIDMTPSWRWLCQDCIPKIESNILELSIKVYWIDDSKYYEGVIDALDPMSHEHRVQYDDGEWEFIKLSHQDFYLKMNPNEFEKFLKMIQKSIKKDIAQGEMEEKGKEDGKERGERDSPLPIRTTRQTPRKGK